MDVGNNYPRKQIAIEVIITPIKDERDNRDVQIGSMSSLDITDFAGKDWRDYIKKSVAN